MEKEAKARRGKRLNIGEYDTEHQFNVEYGNCVKCGTSQREAVGTGTVPGVRCVDEVTDVIKGQVPTPVPYTEKEHEWNECLRLLTTLEV